MNKTFLIALGLMMTVTACHREHHPVATIHGKLTDGAVMKLVLGEMDIHDIRMLDSLTLNATGSFTFTVPVDSAGFWILRAPSGKIMTLLLNQGDRIELTGSGLDFPDRVHLQGPEETMRLHEFFVYTRKHEKQVDSLEMLLIEFQDQEGYYELTQKIDTLFRNIWEAQRKYEIEFIRKNASSLGSLIVLNYAFGLSPVLSPGEDPGWYLLVDSTLQAAFPGNKHVKYHHQRILEYQRTQKTKSDG